MLSMGARDMLKSGFSGSKFQATPEKGEEMLQSAAKQCKERYLPVFEKVSVYKKILYLNKCWQMSTLMKQEVHQNVYHQPQWYLTGISTLS